MANEITTAAVPVAEETPAPVEHVAAPADPNSIEQALTMLAEAPVEEVPVVPAQRKDSETFEPLGTVGNCP
ncbi:hypothetical protein [Kitasatospora griseola]|uniref:hypothetical protein n=1 Tax=Kitasatospora griseola TaxID=2064 RepID=UPI0037FF6886